jgi:hypothetical protein
VSPSPLPSRAHIACRTPAASLPINAHPRPPSSGHSNLPRASAQRAPRTAGSVGSSEGRGSHQRTTLALTSPISKRPSPTTQRSPECEQTALVGSATVTPFGSRTAPGPDSTSTCPPACTQAAEDETPSNTPGLRGPSKRC